MTPAGVSDLRSTLEADETAIEYFSTSGQISAFIASREGIKVVRNIASNDLIEKQIAALRFQFAKFNYGPDFVDANFSQLKRAADAQLASLYQQIFAPIETELKQKLVVIPHGLLHYVPFHALRDGDTYLLDRFEVSYAPSTTVLRLCCESRKQRKPYSDDIAGNKMVALGVTEPGIPAVNDEIESLALLFPGAVTLLGNQATRDNLLRFAPNARFLHLASHGQFRSDNPMFSYLKLVDCQLNFYNLLDLKLGAELVTLSACQTGVNTISPGDELHGLMRGFLHAGAPSLVASLWAVSDRSTSELMKIMYAGIQNGNAKRAALRDAQLAIKDEYGHPYYWAPFILMGDAT
jgi:CHAT domain-containing protein